MNWEENEKWNVKRQVFFWCFLRLLTRKSFIFPEKSFIFPEKSFTFPKKSFIFP